MCLLPKHGVISKIAMLDFRGFWWFWHLLGNLRAEVQLPQMASRQERRQPGSGHRGWVIDAPLSPRNIQMGWQNHHEFSDVFLFPILKNGGSFLHCHVFFGEREFGNFFILERGFLDSWRMFRSFSGSNHREIGISKSEGRYLQGFFKLPCLHLDGAKNVRTRKQTFKI